MKVRLFLGWRGESSVFPRRKGESKVVRLRWKGESKVVF